MSVKKIRVCRELCEKLKYVSDDGKLLDIYGLDIEENESNEQTMYVLPIRKVEVSIGSD